MLTLYSIPKKLKILILRQFLNNIKQIVKLNVVPLLLVKHPKDIINNTLPVCNGSFDHISSHRSYTALSRHTSLRKPVQYWH